MTTWNNIDAKTGLTVPKFDNLLGVMSVGLFQYDITCLQNLCHAQYSHEVNLWCHMVTSEFDGWAIGAYIKSPAHNLPFTASGGTKLPGASLAANQIPIYGGAAKVYPPVAAGDKLNYTYTFYGIGFHHEDKGDTFAAVPYLGFYNMCQNGPCNNSYV